MRSCILLIGALSAIQRIKRKDFTPSHLLARSAIASAVASSQLLSASVASSHFSTLHHAPNAIGNQGGTSTQPLSVHIITSTSVSEATGAEFRDATANCARRTRSDGTWMKPLSQIGENKSA
jgi:hypothetical protein